MSEFECLAWLTDVSAEALFSEGATTSGPKIVNRSLSVLLQTTFGFTNVAFQQKFQKFSLGGIEPGTKRW